MSKAPPERRAAVLRALRRRITPLRDAGALRVVRGKEVVNLLPPVAWHKGSALRWLMELLDALPHRVGGVFPVYIGDDVTDEDAFRVARETGVAVRVGPPRRGSAAPYTVADTDEVEAVLRDMATYSRSLGIG